MVFQCSNCCDGIPQGHFRWASPPTKFVYNKYCPSKQKTCQYAIFSQQMIILRYNNKWQIIKRLFLDGHSYYLTIVTHRRKPILIDNIEALRESFRESKRYYRYTIDAIVILPDHLHMIIIPKQVKEYPKIIRAIKYNF